jgi:hypothetical protein
MAANVLFALVSRARICLFAVAAIDDATDVQNVSVIRVFYEQCLFDQLLALCHDDRTFVRCVYSQF